MKEYDYGSIILFRSKGQICLGRLASDIEGEYSEYDIVIYDSSRPNSFYTKQILASAIIDFAPDGLYKGIFWDTQSNKVTRMCSVYNGHIQYVYENNKQILYTLSLLLAIAVTKVNNNLNLKNHNVELEEGIFL